MSEGILFREGDLEMSFPKACILIHVDSKDAPWIKGWNEKKVDFILFQGGQKSSLIFCEVKDPESLAALSHPPKGGKSHTEELIAALSESAPENPLAQKLLSTKQRFGKPIAEALRSLAASPDHVYLVLLEVTSRDFDVNALTIQNVIERSLGPASEFTPIVVNSKTIGVVVPGSTVRRVSP